MRVVLRARARPTGRTGARPADARAPFDDLKSLSRNSKILLVFAWILSIGAVAMATVTVVRTRTSPTEPGIGSGSGFAELRPTPVRLTDPGLSSPPPSEEAPHPPPLEVTLPAVEPPAPSDQRPADVPEPSPAVDRSPKTVDPPATDEGRRERAHTLRHLIRDERLAEVQDDEHARRIADRVFQTVGSPSDLVPALIEEGADELQARLLALRLSQAAGFEEQSRVSARELKLEHPDLKRVSDAVRGWGVLSPYITSVKPVIRERFVAVTGTLENPDVGAVRRVKVLIEALDGSGRTLASVKTRAKPKLLEPGSNGTFEVRIKGIDPTRVERTRATIVGYEYEVDGSTS